MLETAEAFAGRLSTVMRDRDREGYKALFGLPCMVWRDAGLELRTEESQLDAGFELIRRIFDRLGVVDHVAHIENVIGLGETLTVMRVQTSLSLADGSTTDLTSELWILREEADGLFIRAVVNSVRTDLMDAPEWKGDAFDAAPPRTATGGWPVCGQDFVTRLNRAYDARDVEEIAAMVALPYFRLRDDCIETLLTPEDRIRDIKSYFDILDGLGGGRESIELLAERPIGLSYLVLRVRAHGTMLVGGPIDTAQELWILHESDGALRLAGSVNSAGLADGAAFGDSGETQ